MQVNLCEQTLRVNGQLELVDYRVIYLINEDEKIVLLYYAMHRKKVYR